MKKCPKCNSSFSDDTLRFCLSDGAVLLDVDAEATHELSSEERRELRFDLENNEPETVAFETETVAETREPRRSRLGLFFGGFIAAVIFLSVLGMAALGVYYFAFAEKKVATNQSVNNSNLNSNNNSSTYPQSNSDESKNGELIKDSPTPVVVLPVAVVNSPKDGFLALRSGPNHRTGKLLSKIPHGTVLALQKCQSKRVKIAKNTGRWCQVTHGGKTGWVFDAWLKRR